MDPRRHQVIKKDLIRAIFEELDHLLLNSKWDAGRAIHQEMIMIIVMVYMVNHRL